MKIKQELYEKMKTAMELMINSFGGSQKINERFANKSRITKLWSIWNAASFDLMYDDTHPAYRKKQRVVPYEEGFNVYNDDDINDSHIETALKKIGTELGI